MIQLVVLAAVVALFAILAHLAVKTGFIYRLLYKVNYTF